MNTKDRQWAPLVEFVVRKKTIKKRERKKTKMIDDG